MSEIAADAIRYIEKSPYALLITVGEEKNAPFKPFSRYVGMVGKNYIIPSVK
jgi:hypothetical protein